MDDTLGLLEDEHRCNIEPIRLAALLTPPWRLDSFCASCFYSIFMPGVCLPQLVFSKDSFKGITL